jgi:hypothetical protein
METVYSSEFPRQSYSSVNRLQKPQSFIICTIVQAVGKMPYLMPGLRSPKPSLKFGILMSSHVTIIDLQPSPALDILGLPSPNMHALQPIGEWFT